MALNLRPLFGAGTARGGTGLVVQTLRANSRIELAMEPFLSIFKHYRLAVHQDLAATNDHRVPPLSDPIRSLYFNSDDLRYSDRILDSPSDYGISPAELADIKRGISQRAEYDAVDLLPHVDDILGSSYSEVIGSAIEMVQNARGAADLAYCGFLENWCAEFFPFLADQFPESKFFLVVRDPRAVICSALYAPENLRSTLLSYARSIRKNLDLYLHYADDPRFAGRLCMIKFEALVNDPAGITPQVCEFLEVDYEPEMIDPAYHVVPGSAKLRNGVSSFEKQAIGYSPERATRWKNILETELTDIVNALMYPELVAFGYLDPSTPPTRFDGPLLAKVLSNERVRNLSPSWSIESFPDSAEYGAELLRAIICEGGFSSGGPDCGNLMRECFITERIANTLLEPGMRNEDWRRFDKLVIT